MKNSFKHLLVAILVLAAVVLPVFGSADSFKATEAGTETTTLTQGEITTCASYDWEGGGANYQVIALASEDDTMIGADMFDQTPEKNDFGWWYNFLLEYNEEKGTWVVTKTDMVMDGVNNGMAEGLGAGKMVIMFHDGLVNGNPDSFNFYKTNVVEGAEFYLSVHPSYIYDMYDWVDDAFLSTVPVEVKAPAVEDTTADDTEADTTDDTTDDTTGADDKGGVNPILIVAIVVVVIAIVGVVIVVSKRKKAN